MSLCFWYYNFLYSVSQAMHFHDLVFFYNWLIHPKSWDELLKAFNFQQKLNNCRICNNPYMFKIILIWNWFILLTISLVNSVILFFQSIYVWNPSSLVNTYSSFESGGIFILLKHLWNIILPLCNTKPMVDRLLWFRE